MAGISGILSVARSALLASQQAVEVTGNNVANVHTPGYTRQRVDQVESPSVYLPPAGHFGTGVTIDGVTRARDSHLDQIFRANAGQAGHASARRNALTELEAVFGEPSASGLAAGLDQFWNGWSDLASNPTSLPARGVVQQRGAHVATQLNRFAADLDALSTQARDRAQVMVDDINGRVAQIAGLNRDIVSAESGGHTANTLRDERDRILDELAGYGELQVVEAANGSIGVHLGGHLLVDAADPHALTLTPTGGTWQVAFAETPQRPFAVGGALDATLGMLNEALPGAMATLDRLARGLVDTVNTVHQSGVLFDGTVPPPAAPEFFRTDPLAADAESDRFRTARGIQLGALVAANAANIAASDAAATGPSNNDVATRLAKLRDTTVAFTEGGQVVATDTIGNVYRALVTSIGLETSRAASDASVHYTLMQSADMRRLSVGGVSQDEELANLIKYQQSYAAAARLITVADDLARTLIDMAR